MKITVPNVPPVTHVKVPLLAVYWANSTTIIKTNGRRKARGKVRARSYNLRRGKTVIRLLNKKIKYLFKKRKYSAKWAFIVNWDVTYSGGSKTSPVSRTARVFVIKTRTYYTM